MNKEWKYWISSSLVNIICIVVSLHKNEPVTFYNIFILIGVGYLVFKACDKE